MMKNVIMGGCLYLLQERLPNGSVYASLKPAGQIIRAYGFRDCSNAEYEVYEVSVFGEATKLVHEAQTQPPFNYHRFVNPKTGEVAFAGFSPEH